MIIFIQTFGNLGIKYTPTSMQPSFLYTLSLNMELFLVKAVFISWIQIAQHEMAILIMAKKNS